MNAALILCPLWWPHFFAGDHAVVLEQPQFAGRVELGGKQAPKLGGLHLLQAWKDGDHTPRPLNLSKEVSARWAEMFRRRGWRAFLDDGKPLGRQQFAVAVQGDGQGVPVEPGPVEGHGGIGVHAGEAAQPGATVNATPAN